MREQIGPRVASTSTQFAQGSPAAMRIVHARTTVLKTTLLVLCLTACGLWLEAVAQDASAPATAPPAPASANAPNATSSSQGEPPGAESVKLLESFSEKAIESEQHSIDTIKWMLAFGASLVTAIVAVGAFLGYRELKTISEDARRQARRAVQSELTDLREICVAAKDIATESARTLRYLMSVAGQDPPEQDIIRKALWSIRHVREQAKKLADLKYPDPALEAWTYSMEAYCFASLDDFEEAVKTQREALKIAAQHHAVSYLNLACYLNRAGHPAEAAEQVKKAIAVGGDKIRQRARVDDDLETLRRDKKYEELFA